MSKQERLLPPLSKDHPIFKRGYIVGLETIICVGHKRALDVNIEQSTPDPECSSQEPETMEDT